MSKRTPLQRALFESKVLQKDLADAVGIHTTRMSHIANGLHCDRALKDAIATELSRLAEDGGADRTWTVADLFPPVEVAA
jgi:predicted XRE-type DNA-binding protein